MNLLEALKAKTLQLDTTSSVFTEEDTLNKAKVSIKYAIEFSKQNLSVLHLTGLKELNCLAGLYLEKLSGKLFETDVDFSKYENILKNINVEIYSDSIAKIQIPKETQIIVLDAKSTTIEEVNEIQKVSMENQIPIMMTNKDDETYNHEETTFKQMETSDVRMIKIGNLSN